MDAANNNPVEQKEDATPTTSSEDGKNEGVTPRKGATAIPRRTPARKANPKSTRKGAGGNNQNDDASPAKASPGAETNDSGKPPGQDEGSEHDKDTGPIAKKPKRGRPKK